MACFTKTQEHNGTNCEFEKYVTTIKFLVLKSSDKSHLNSICTLYVCDKRENAWVCAKWLWNALDWCYWIAFPASPVVQSSNTVWCVSLSFRTHPCILAIEPPCWGTWNLAECCPFRWMSAIWSHQINVMPWKSSVIWLFNRLYRLTMKSVTFCSTVLLWAGSTGHQWIPHAKVAVNHRNTCYITALDSDKDIHLSSAFHMTDCGE